MNLSVLEIMFWILSIRGHIPQFGEYECPPIRNEAQGATSRIVIGSLISAAVFALLLWLAIRLI